MYYVSYYLNGKYQLDVCWSLDEAFRAFDDAKAIALQGHDVSSLTINYYRV